MSSLIDFSVVGSGMGGISIASLLQKYDTHLFEKEPYLGGSASTFKKNKHYFNTGATTFSLYEKNHIIYNYFKQLNLNNKLEQNIIRTNPAIRVILNNKNKYKTIDRSENFDKFVENFAETFELRTVNQKKLNLEFWQLVKKISDIFYANLEQLYYSKYEKINTVKSFANILLKMPFDTIKSGSKIVNKYFNNQNILDFIDNQVIIVAQTKSHNTNFLTVALALSYTFYGNFYSIGGMGKIFDLIATKIANIHKNSEIKNIIFDKDKFILETEKKSFQTKKVILNSSIFSNKIKFYNMPKLIEYKKKLQKLDSNQSAFLVYLNIKINNLEKIKLNHHYQIILDETIPETISNSIFISISDKNDEILTSNNIFSVTISTHTDNKFWKNNYYEKKEKLQNFIQNIFINTFRESEKINFEIKNIFSATPETFNRYINRYTLGGIPATTKNLFNIISPETPIKNLYFIGDNIFMAQGWVGTIKGATNLHNILKNHQKE
jgi:phytoene dehydrogenase-like protein